MFPEKVSVLLCVPSHSLSVFLYRCKYPALFLGAEWAWPSSGGHAVPRPLLHFLLFIKNIYNLLGRDTAAEAEDPGGQRTAAPQRSTTWKEGQFCTGHHVAYRILSTGDVLFPSSPVPGEAVYSTYSQLAQFTESS